MRMWMKSAFIAAALSFQFGGSPSTAQTLEKVRTTSIPFYTGFSVYVAHELGLFKKHGIDTEPKWYPSGAPIVQSAAAGQWDMTFLGAPPAVLGGPTLGLKTVGMIVEEADIHQLIGRPELVAKIKADPKALKGAKIFVTTLSTGHFMTEGCLKHFGLTQNDVQIIPSEQAATLSAFVAGQGDLAQAWPPASTTLRIRGNQVLCDGPMDKQSIPSVWVAHPKFHQEKPHLVKKWIAANIEAVAWMKADPARTLELFTKYDKFRGFNSTEEVLKEETRLAMGSLDANAQLALLSGKDGAKPYIVNSYEKIAEFFVRVGRLKEVPNYGPLVDASFMRDVAAGK